MWWSANWRVCDWQAWTKQSAPIQFNLKLKHTCREMQEHGQTVPFCSQKSFLADVQYERHCVHLDNQSRNFYCDLPLFLQDTHLRLVINRTQEHDCHFLRSCYSRAINLQRLKCSPGHEQVSLLMHQCSVTMSRHKSVEDI